MSQIRIFSRASQETLWNPLTRLIEFPVCQGLKGKPLWKIAARIWTLSLYGLGNLGNFFSWSYFKQAQVPHKVWIWDPHPLFGKCPNSRRNKFLNKGILRPAPPQPTFSSKMSKLKVKLFLPPPLFHGQCPNLYCHFQQAKQGIENIFRHWSIS